MCCGRNRKKVKPISVRCRATTPAENKAVVIVNVGGPLFLLAAASKACNLVGKVRAGLFSLACRMMAVARDLNSLLN